MVVFLVLNAIVSCVTVCPAGWKPGSDTVSISGAVTYSDVCAKCIMFNLAQGCSPRNHSQSIFWEKYSFFVFFKHNPDFSS